MNKTKQSPPLIKSFVACEDFTGGLGKQELSLLMAESLDCTRLYELFSMKINTGYSPVFNFNYYMTHDCIISNLLYSFPLA